MRCGSIEGDQSDWFWSRLIEWKILDWRNLDWMSEI